MPLRFFRLLQAVCVFGDLVENEEVVVPDALRGGGWVGGWVGGWMGSLFLYLSNEVLESMGGCVDGGEDGGSNALLYGVGGWKERGLP